MPKPIAIAALRINRKGHVDAAIEEHNRAIALKPNYAEAYNTIAVAASLQ